MQKSTKYECPRCLYTGNKWAYEKHVTRQTTCKASDSSKENVVPTIDNAIVRCSMRHNGVEVTVNSDKMHGADAPTTIINNTVNTGDNATILQINWGDAIPRTDALPHRTFPNQDYFHLTTKEKRAIVDSAGDGTYDGFVKALRQLQKSSYFNPQQPHNMNVRFRNRLIAFIFDKNKKWTEVRAEKAINDMLDEYASAIVNFPDDPDIDGRVSRAQVRIMDAEEGRKTYLTDDAVNNDCLTEAVSSSARLNDLAKLANRHTIFGRSEPGMMTSKHEEDARIRYERLMATPPPGGNIEI